MKKVFFIGLLSLCSSAVFGQIKVELEMGGANFVGASINTAYDIPLGKSGNHFLTPRIGLGANFFDNRPLSTQLFGLDYRYQRWSIGVEAVNFSTTALWGPDFHNSWIDVLLHPYVSYTFGALKPKSVYYRIGAGIYLPFTNYVNFADDSSNWRFDGDPIPGGSLSVGYRF